MKLFLNCKSETDKIPRINDLIDEEVILGKNRFLNFYSKNYLYNHWIDIVK